MSIVCERRTQGEATSPTQNYPKDSNAGTLRLRIEHFYIIELRNKQVGLPTGLRTIHIHLYLVIRIPKRLRSKSEHLPLTKL